MKLKFKCLIFFSILFLYRGILICGNNNGPIQPEFSKFESITNENMVDEYTGSFTYKIPLLSLPGANGVSFPIMLFYKSGTTPMEDASWVGYGWTLNPGSIVRQVNGFPDDYKNTKVVNWTKTRPNITYALNFASRAEHGSKDAIANVNTNSYNTYTGYHSSIGINIYPTPLLKSLKVFSESFPITLPTLGLTYKNGELNFNTKAFFYSLFKQTLNSLDGLLPKVNPLWTFVIRNSWGTIANSIGGYLINILNIGNTNYSTSFPEYYAIQREFTPTLNLLADCTNGIENDLFANSITKQIVKPRKDYSAYGFMYTSDAKDKSDVMDYYSERDFPFNKRDRFLPIPFSAPDDFIVMGEGMTGGFRLYHNRVGEFRPAYRKSEVDISGWGLTLSTNFALNPIGIGGDFSNGYQLSEIIGWKNRDGKDYSFSSPNDEGQPLMFRFNSDLGGTLNYFNNNSRNYLGTFALAFGVAGSYATYFSLPGVANNSHLYYNNYNGSSYIGYNILRNTRNIWDGTPIGNTFNFPSRTPYNLDIHTEFKGNSILGASDYGISEFSIVNKDGNRYTYGIPVFSRNERNIAYGITNLKYSPTDYNGTTELDNYTNDGYIAYSHKTPENGEGDYTVIGEEKNEPYVSSYLLTSITSPDYVDLSNDGPTSDDLGGYVKFDYERTAGSDFKSDIYVDQWRLKEGYSSNANYEAGKSPKEMNDLWYKWRIPYNGLKYNRNSQSDRRDDIGNVTMGEKEIYYLKKIETKTHMAIFVTNKSIYNTKKLTGYQSDNITPIAADIQIQGSASERLDSYEANHNEYQASGSKYAKGFNEGSSAPPENKLRYLERIELWSKEIAGSISPIWNGEILAKKLMTVHFEYDYSAWPKQVNSMKSDGQNLGKLTLKKIWFEYEDVKDYDISPYQFFYDYIQQSYPNITNIDIDENYGTNLNQTPEFNLLNIDRWGNYAIDNEDLNTSNNDGDPGIEDKFEFSRIKNERPWVTQKPLLSFDPAAWQLKRITLPQGGEVHVQYEQNQYANVQDQPAMAMVRVHKLEAYGVEIDLSADLDVDNTNYSQIEQFKNRLIDYLTNNTDNILYKFLYSIVGGNEKANLRNCEAEYIKGYFPIDPAKVSICTLSTSPQVRYGLRLEYHNEINYPERLCRDYIVNNRNGIYTGSKSTNCDVCSSGGIQINYETEDDVKDKSWLSKFFDQNSSNYCKAIDGAHSYIRIPLPENFPKKGGGIRVKNLILFDKFNSLVNNTTPTIYGSKYFYENEFGYCSGVASNEPSIGKEENALVKHLNFRNKQNKIDEWSNGFDLEQFEGPFGEAIMPVQSVGYSSVIIENLYKGASNNSYRNNTYLTYKDFPCFNDKTFSFTNLDEHTSEPFLINPSLSAPGGIPIYLTYDKFELNMCQSYSFIKYDIAGKIKSSTIYHNTGNLERDWKNPILKTEYEYFNYNDPIPLFSNHQIFYGFPGRIDDCVIDNRIMREIGKSDIGDVDIIFPGFTPIPCYLGFELIRGLTSSIVQEQIINHITHYPALVKRVVTNHMIDNIQDTVEYAAFDPISGEPLITRRVDGYNKLDLWHSEPQDGSYYNYLFPAAQQYNEMSQKSISERFKLKSDESTRIIRRCSTFTNTQTNGIEANFSLIINFEPNQTKCDCEIFKIFSPGDLLKLQLKGSTNPESYSEYFNVKSISGNILALEPYYEYITNTITNNFLNTSQLEMDVEILRSGRANKLNEPAGNLVTYGQTDENSMVLKNGFNRKADPLRPLPCNNIDLSLNSKYQADYYDRTILADALNHYLTCNPKESGIILPEGYEIDILGPNREPITLNNGNINSIITIDRAYDIFNPDASFYDFTLCVKKFDVATQPCSTLAYDPLVKDLNNLLDRIYSMNLVEEIPSFDWFGCAYLSTDKIDANHNQRYETIEIKDKVLIEQIVEKSGLNDIVNKYYKFGNGYHKGSDFIRFVDNPRKINIIVDKYKKYALIGMFYLEFYYNNISSYTPAGENNWWFGLYRQTKTDVTGNKSCGLPSRLVDGGYHLDNSEYEIDVSGKFGYWFKWSDSRRFNYCDCDGNNYIIKDNISYNSRFFDDWEGKVPYTTKVGQFKIDGRNLKFQASASSCFNSKDVVLKDFVPENLQLDEYKCCTDFRFGSSKAMLCTGPFTSWFFSDEFPIEMDPFKIDKYNLSINFSPNIKSGVIDKWECFDTTFEHIDYDYWSYTQPPCNGSICLQFYNKADTLRNYKGVVAANANTYTDKWFDDDELLIGPVRYSPYGYGDLHGNLERNYMNDYVWGFKGRWKSDSTFVYNTDTKTGWLTNQNYLNYNHAGEYPDEFNMFNWVYPSFISYMNYDEQQQSDVWVNTSAIKDYTPHMMPFVETDILRTVPSTVLYNMEGNIPSCIASNADKHSVYFNSFEPGYLSPVSGLNLSSTHFHSGHYSCQIGTQDITNNPIKINQQIINYGIIIKFWTKAEYNGSGTPDPDIDPIIKCDLKYKGTYELTNQDFEILAKCGEWYLYELIVPHTYFANSTNDDDLTVTFKLEPTYKTNNVAWIDDIKIQPTNSTMNAYVYDFYTHKLIAIFDDTHFGKYYQYNEEGKLKRKLLETYRGMKTISEANYNEPSIWRDGSIPAMMVQSVGNNGDNQKQDFLNDGAKDFQLFDINLSPSNQSFKIFGIDARKLINSDSLKNELISIPDSVSKLPFNNVIKAHSIEEMKNLENNQIINKEIKKVQNLESKIKEKADTLEKIKNIEIEQDVLNSPQNIKPNIKESDSDRIKKKLIGNDADKPKIIKSTKK